MILGQGIFACPALATINDPPNKSNGWLDKCKAYPEFSTACTKDVLPQRPCGTITNTCNKRGS